MVTFNFSNVSGDASGRRFVDSTVTSPSFPSITTSVTRTEGVNPIEFTSNLTGQGLPGDTMTFTVTANSLLYRMLFVDSADQLRLRTSGGLFSSTATYTLRFDAGSGLTKLSNISLNGGSGVNGTVMLLTESGTIPAGNGTGTLTGEFTGIRFTVTDAQARISSITGTPTCFAEGTRIATPDGDVDVQDLMQGDVVLTHDGATREVLWI